MRILFLIESLSSGGAERQLVNLMNGLVSKGHKVYCITWVNKHHYSKCDIPGVLWFQLERNYKFDIKFFLFVRSLIKKSEISIIQGFLDTGSLFALISSFGLKNVKVFASERSALRNLNFFAKFYKPLVHKLVFKTIVNSDAGKSYLESLCGKKIKIELVRNCFDCKLFYLPSESEKIELRKKYNIGQSTRVFLNVARIVPLKRQFEIVTAFINVSQNDDSILILIGLSNDVYLNKIQKYIIANNFSDRIRILEPERRIQDFYKLADVFVLYSSYEGSPNVLVEAILSGLFVVSSKCGDSEFYLGLTEGNELISQETKFGLELAFKKILKYDQAFLYTSGHENRLLLTSRIDLSVDEMVKNYERIYSD